MYCCYLYLQSPVLKYQRILLFNFFLYINNKLFFRWVQLTMDWWYKTLNAKSSAMPWIDQREQTSLHKLEQRKHVKISIFYRSNNGMHETSETEKLQKIKNIWGSPSKFSRDTWPLTIIQVLLWLSFLRCVLYQKVFANMSNSSTRAIGQDQEPANGCLISNKVWLIVWINCSNSYVK